MSRRIVLTVCILAALGMTVGMTLAFSPALEPVHEYDVHQHNLEDIAYDAEHESVWSIDNDLEETVTFAGYNITEEAIVLTETFENGHALTVGTEHVYIADADTLWSYHVTTDNFTEFATMSHHPAGMEYDSERGVIWAAGGHAVMSYDAENGTEIVHHEAHEHGISDIGFHGDYVASSATWEDEVIVYDIEEGEIVFAPDLPEEVDGVGALHITTANELIIGAGEIIQIYDIESQTLIAEAEGHIFGTSDVTFYEEHGVLISVGFDNTAKLFDLEAQTAIDRYEHDDTIYTADLDRENELLWFGDGEDEKSGTVIGLDLHTDTVDDSPPDDAQADDDDELDDAPADDGVPNDDSDATDDAVGDDADEADDTVEDPADDSDDDAADPDDGQAGFGVIAAIVATLAAGVYYRHRE